MIYAIIIMLLLIAFTYRGDLFMPRVKGKSLLYSYRRLLALLGMTIVPIVILNYAHPTLNIDSPEDKITLANYTHDYDLAEEGYEELADRDYPNVEAQFRYIDYINTTYYHDRFCYVLTRKYKKAENATDIVALTYSRYYCSGLAPDKELIDQLDKDSAYSNYIKAIYYLTEYDYDRAEKYAKNELIINPDFEKTYSLLVDIYWESSADKLDSLLNSEAAYHIDPDFTATYYFVNGQIFNYMVITYIDRFGSPDIFAYIAAFLISLVWMVFIRRLDIFNREKWIHIAIVFLLATFMTHFCLLWYDYSQIYLDLYIRGEAINDFIYCFFVIGLGEETVKLIPWILFGLLSRKLKEPFDYLLYASVAALGFAFAENLMYLENTQNIIGRSIMAAVGHMFDACVVAYGFILARYKFKKLFWKIITPVIGFFLGVLAHAFYDFWLISPAFESLWFITVIFFIASLHVWKYFMNNAMNNSQFYRPEVHFNPEKQKDLLTFAILGLLIVEFAIISIKVGADYGNKIFGKEFVIVAIFLAYMSVMIDGIRVDSGVWSRFKFRPNFKINWSRLGGGMFRFPGQQGTEELPDDTDLTGLSLRLFAPKTNPYIGQQLPQKGICVKRIKVSGDNNWYVFQLAQPVVYQNFLPNQIIIRHRDNQKSLLDDKIEIYFMLIPSEEILFQEEIDIQQLRFVGPAFSRPID